ncbi:hypothetical protein D9Q98_009397 [Chlorella vulgaris]|uniref:Uncharacterized protein n=1 Tax=Chlorella vulgaris TaxID=3077 RepID=A0A9D4TPC9_CHLVU|nr:hypothetical protein D9Q98_009397 [Chlorella vulgaris]
MSAIIPRSKSGSKQPKLSRSTEQSCREKPAKKRQVSSGAGVQHSLSGKSAQELSHTGSHPWSGFAEAVLRPLPPDWRYNIEKAFSDLGEAVGKLLGGGQQGARHRTGRRGF